jgi:NADH-quinone oxidoreductase subunit A
MLSLSYLLGERHRERATTEPYESGIAATGDAHVRFSVPFYLTALFFLVFDLEAAFLFAWAVAARELGWRGYWGALFFVGILFCLLVYEWKTGALSWGPKPAFRRKS